MNEISEIVKAATPTAKQITDAAFIYNLLKTDQAKKLLKPMASYYRQWLVKISKRGNNFIAKNISRVLSTAINNIPPYIKSQGYASPRVVKKIVDEAMTSTNFITDTYLGCVLASSISEGGRDDRGITMSNLISRLSTYQIRAHYIFYHALKEVFNGYDITTTHELEGMHVFIPLQSFEKSLGYQDGESESICCFALLIGHIASGLAKEGLITSTYDFGAFHTDHPPYVVKNTIAGGIFTPTLLGIELFGWAYGSPRTDCYRFFDKAYTFPINKRVKKPSECYSVAEKNKRNIIY